MAGRNGKGKGHGARRAGDEIWGIALVLLAVLSYFGLLTDAAGEAGAFLAEWLFRLFGRYGAYVFPVLVLAAGVLVAIGRAPRADARSLGVLLAFWLLLTFFHLPEPEGAEFEVGRAGAGGGLLGATGAYVLARVFGRRGRALVMAALGLVAFLAVTGLSLGRALGLFFAGLRWMWTRAGDEARDFVAGVKSKAGPRGTVARGSFQEVGNGRFVRAEGPAAGPAGPLAQAGAPPGDALAAARQAQSAGLAVPGTPEGARAAGAGKTEAAATAPAAGRFVPHPVPARAADGAFLRRYELPSTGLLRKPPPSRPGRATQDVQARARLLEETFASFGVGVKVMEINPGPTVTRFEVRPAPGVKVSRVEALAEDVALNLAAADVRIAPIPGKGLVGVEVPNTEVSVVCLREALESQEFIRSRSLLTVAVGKDIAGQVIVSDLERMLHVLIAGATGSGKSVCLNSLIVSILFKARPDEVKFLLIDPKVVELQVFDGIPHLLAPVINDPKRAAHVLKWAVREMVDRYFRFAEAGVRNISDYNRLAKARAVAAAAGLDGGATGVTGAGAAPEADLKADSKEAYADLASPRQPEEQTGDHAAYAPGEYLPHIVIVIDELNDLMMIAPVEVEDCIWRLSQMARAAGIYLVVATQRPSVNVITGVIKANMPSRIAFAVASQVDSRTILDMAGAEKLLGRGDMLFHPYGAGKPIRAQGALITDREVQELVKYVRQQGPPVYMESFPLPEGEQVSADRSLDPKWADALRVVFGLGQASTSMLQRRLRIGYTRAARIVDLMQELGIAAKSDGVKPRDVLMTMDQYVERFGSPEQQGQPLR